MLEDGIQAIEGGAMEDRARAAAMSSKVNSIRILSVGCCAEQHEHTYKSAICLEAYGWKAE